MRKRKVTQVELEINSDSVDKILEEGITCCAEVEVGQVVDCLFALFEHIRETHLVQSFKERLGPEHDRDLDKFLMLLLVSEVATITNNFKDKEKESVGDA